MSVLGGFVAIEIDLKPLQGLKHCIEILEFWIVSEYVSDEDRKQRSEADT